MLRVLIFVSLAVFAAAENKAIAVLQGNGSVTGSITFTETKDGIFIQGEIKGLSPGNHGFHIHSKGDLTDGCSSTGSHFNPYNKTHGAPDAEIRHVGDLGNVLSDENKVAKISFMDKAICLTGETGILGRAVVVHVAEDDLGLKDTDESRTTGSAGGRLACGVIGILSDDFKYKGGTGYTSPSILVMCTSLLIYFKYWK